jgi:hypothetical protein
MQQHTDRLDPDDIWSMIEREQLNFLLIVGDAFGRPLLDQLEAKLRPVVAHRASCPAAQR